MNVYGIIRGQRVRALLVILPLVLLLCLSATASAWASGPLSLSGGQASPGAGTADGAALIAWEAAHAG